MDVGILAATAARIRRRNTGTAIAFPTAFFLSIFISSSDAGYSGDGFARLCVDDDECVTGEHRCQTKPGKPTRAALAQAR